jgi:hypothetical protein
MTVWFILLLSGVALFGINTGFIYCYGKINGFNIVLFIFSVLLIVGPFIKLCGAL